MHTNEPDYSKYTLEELYDVAQHIDRVRYAERYNRVLEEIEKKTGEPLPPVQTAKPWREWIFEHGDSPRNCASIIAWWEKRRAFYIRYFFGVLACSLFTGLCFAFAMTAKRGGFSPFSFQISAIPQIFIGIVGWLIGITFLCGILSSIVFAVISIAYVFFWLSDIALNVPLRFFGWRLSVALFQFALAATLLVLSVPAVWAFVALLS